MRELAVNLDPAFGHGIKRGHRWGSCGGTWLRICRALIDHLAPRNGVKRWAIHYAIGNKIAPQLGIIGVDHPTRTVGGLASMKEKSRTRFYANIAQGQEHCTGGLTMTRNPEQFASLLVPLNVYSKLLRSAALPVARRRCC